MTDYNFPSASDEADSGLQPAASLTSIPVRRRRKSGGVAPKVSAPKASAPRQHGGTNASDPSGASPVRPRKETFGKLRTVAVPAVPDVPDTTAAIEPVATPTTELVDTQPESGIAAVDAPTLSPASTDSQSAAQPPEGIIALWESLVGEDSIPALLDLDVTRIGAHWPNSLLLRATGSPRRPEVEVARIFSSDAAHHTAPLPIDTMAIDWMIALAREVTHDGVPVHELDSLSIDDSGVEYGVIALPFGSAPDAVDHVLCHLYRYTGPSAEEAQEQAASDRPAGHRAGRKMVASIFGRRQSASG